MDECYLGGLGSRCGLESDDQSSKLRVLQNCGWLQWSHSGARLIRPIRQSRLLRAGCQNFPIDHIAFEIPPAEFADERKRLEALGLEVETTEHAWVHWRSLYVTDPEGNQVELVCYDESV